MMNDNGSPQIEMKSILFILGLSGIMFNLFYNRDKYYLGEPLIEKNIIVSDPPEYINTERGGTDRYTLSGEEYLCKFWISEGRLSLIRENQAIEHKLKAIKKSDTIIIKIRQTDELYLQTESSRLRIFELSNKNEQILNAIEVGALDSKWYRINLGLPVAALVIGLIIQIRQMVMKRRREN